MFVLRDTFQRVFGFSSGVSIFAAYGVEGGTVAGGGRRIICFWKSEMLVSGLWLFAEFLQSHGQILQRLPTARV